MRYGAKLADRWSRRWPLMIGFGVQALVMSYFANLPPAFPLWGMGLGIAMHGAAAGMSLAVLHLMAMDYVPQNRGVAAGLYSMMRFFGKDHGATIGRGYFGASA